MTRTLGEGSGPATLLQLPYLFLLAFACAPPPQGLEVVAVDPGGMAAKAGLAVGDRVVSYSFPVGAAPGAFTSCLDVAGAELELSPRGPVAVQLVRQGRRLELTLPLGDWLFDVAPGTDGSPAARTCRGLEAATKAYLDNQPEAEERAYDEAAAAAAELGDPMAVALVRHRQGLARLYRDRFDAAEQAMNEALELRQKAAPESLTLAVSWHGLGRLGYARGRLEASDAAFIEARKLRAQHSPESLDLFWTLNNLGVNAYQRHDLAGAERFYSEARALAERIAPGSRELAGTENNLGLLARERGQLEVARDRLNAARLILQRADPGGEMAARNLMSLAAVALDRGDHLEAERANQEALQYFEKREPESLVVAQIFEDLGKIARDRADFRQAEILLRRSLVIRQKQSGGPQAEARALSPLAWVLFKLGKLQDAEALSKRILAMRAAKRPESTAGSAEEAGAHHTLAEVAAMRGQLDGALSHMETALRWIRRFLPGSLRLALALESYGGFLSQADRAVAADTAYRESITLFESLAPDSFQLANAWGGYGRLLERQGETLKAAEAYRHGIAALEVQISRLGGGDDARANFESEYAYLYHRLVLLESQFGRSQAALEVLERSRGRGLLAELLTRDLTFGEELTPSLHTELREIELAYDRAQRQLAENDETSSPERRARLLAELAALRGRRAVATERITSAAPRYAALRYPRPAQVDAMRDQLEAGTVWLSFMTSDRGSLVFVVRSAADEPDLDKGLRAVPLAADRAGLASEVAILRSLILRGREHPHDSRALLLAGQRLYRLLIAPAEEEVRAAQRLLISPDGPLHLLPFAALVQPGDRPRFLVEEKPTFTALSVGVYGELSRGRDSESAPPFSFAFVNPAPGAPKLAAGGSLSALGRYRAGLAPLPGAGREAELLSGLFPGHVRVFADRGAREQAVKQLPGDARFVHFACHALIDAESPLDSGLALASEGQGLEDDENGLLQGWEIFSRVRVRTPLVTLSACETGLGSEGGGEGLIGLARAFQFAGARSVLASLWQVSDRSTATLMEHFYREWAAGKTREVALAEAQRALIAAGGPAAHPYRWAAFTLNGDPR